MSGRFTVALLLLSAARYALAECDGEDGTCDAEEMAMLQSARDKTKKGTIDVHQAADKQEVNKAIVFCTPGQMCSASSTYGAGQEKPCPSSPWTSTFGGVSTPFPAGSCGQQYPPGGPCGPSGCPSPGPSPRPGPSPSPYPAPRPGPSPGYSGAYCNPNVYPKQLCPTVPGYAPGPYPCPPCGSDSCQCPR